MYAAPGSGPPKTEHGFAVRVAVVAGYHRLVATAPHREGERILRFDGILLDHPTRTSLQVGAGEHLDLPPGLSTERAARTYPWIFLNHACEPTAVRRGRDLLALRPIAPRSEITFDYCTTELELSAPFRCRCSSPTCRGEMVRGFRHLSRAEQDQRRPGLSPHLRAWLDAGPRAAQA